MAASGSTSRAIYAGLSCGFVFAVPVASYVATIPFADANSTVVACALPFTVGALAGVGILSAVSAVGARRAERDEAGEGEAAASRFAFTGEAEHHDVDEDAVERFFGSRKVPKDVPVIARAQDALSEEDAWAEIDSMLSEDSPISCDATTSKDIYEIAFEELRRETQAAQHASARPAEAAAGAHAASAVSAEPAAASASEAAPAAHMAPAGSHAASASAGAPAPAAMPAALGDASSLPAPGSTAMYLAMAQVAASAAAAEHAHAAAATGSLSSSAVPEPADPVAGAAPGVTTVIAAAPAEDTTARVLANDDWDTGEAQRAALASLDEIDGSRLRPAIPVIHASAPAPAGVERLRAAASRASDERAAAPAPAPVAESAPSEPAPQKAYAGHEDMWASALDILEAASPADSAPVPSAYQPRHLRTAAPASETSSMPAPGYSRAAAVAEGRRANEMHDHVNSLIEEELSQVSSSSVRRSSREYLRVIQGGTASMPRLKAEA